MQVAEQVKDMYEGLDPKETLFFRVGAHGQISFHGHHYHIKKRMSAEQRQQLLNDPAFLKAGPDVYVNVGKVTAIEEDQLLFGTSKQLPVSRRVQQTICQLNPAVVR